MKLTRATLALALSSSLLLAACSGADEPEQSSETVATSDAATTTAGDAASASDGPGDGTAATGDAASSTGDAASATGDAAGSTGDSATATGDAASSTDDGTVTAPAAGAGLISVDEAQDVADKLLDQAAQSQIIDADKAMKLNKKTFAGSDLRAANKATELREVGLKPVIDYHPHNVNILAISREDDNRRGYIVAQTVPESGVPELHLLTSQNSGDTWRITWSAPMLAGTELNTFDARSVGSPVIRSGHGDLNRAPSKVVADLVKLITYPREDDLPTMLTNGYAPQVRKATRDQTRAVAEQAKLTQKYKLRDGSLRPIEFADGSALIFPVLERRSTFKVKSGMLLDPPSEYRFFTGDNSVNNKATVDALVFAAIHVKSDGSVNEVVAAREQIIGASGN